MTHKNRMIRSRTLEKIIPNYNCIKLIKPFVSIDKVFTASNNISKRLIHVLHPNEVRHNNEFI